MLEQVKEVINNRVEFWRVEIDSANLTVLFNSPEEGADSDFKIPISYSLIGDFCYLNLDRYNKQR